jgi:hypothetical protein
VAGGWGGDVDWAGEESFRIAELFRVMGCFEVLRWAGRAPPGVFGGFRVVSRRFAVLLAESLDVAARRRTGAKCLSSHNSIICTHFGLVATWRMILVLSHNAVSLF